MRTITLILFCLTIGACAPTPVERLTTTNESLKEYIANIEDSLRLGAMVNWREADHRIGNYCSTPAVGVSSGIAETEQQELAC